MKNSNKPLLKTNLLITDEFYNITKKETNEDIVFNIMNDSKIVFNGKYKQIPQNEQNKGESDYLDVTDEKHARAIDLKLLFDEEICYAINNGCINEFAERIREYINEVYNCVFNGTLIEDTVLYKEFINVLSKLKEDEDGILLFPFPLGLKLDGSLASNLGCDNFQIVFNAIKNNRYDLIKKKRIYFINLNIENKILVYELTNSKNLEFLDKNYIQKYVSVQNNEVYFE